MKFLISIMEAGPLPPEWYFAKANPETEVNHVKYWILIIKWGLLIYIAISTILIAVCGIIVLRNRGLERRIKAAEVGRDDGDDGDIGGPSAEMTEISEVK